MGVRGFVDRARVVGDKGMVLTRPWPDQEKRRLRIAQRGSRVAQRRGVERSGEIMSENEIETMMVDAAIAVHREPLVREPLVRESFLAPTFAVIPSRVPPASLKMRHRMIQLVPRALIGSVTFQRSARLAGKDKSDLSGLLSDQINARC